MVFRRREALGTTAELKKKVTKRKTPAAKLVQTFRPAQTSFVRRPVPVTPPPLVPVETQRLAGLAGLPTEQLNIIAGRPVTKVAEGGFAGIQSKAVPFSGGYIPGGGTPTLQAVERIETQEQRLARRQQASRQTAIQAEILAERKAITPISAPRTQLSLIAERARLTGLSMFGDILGGKRYAANEGVETFPNIISIDVAMQLPFNPLSTQMKEAFQEAFGVDGFETAQEFLDAVGYIPDPDNPRRWLRQAPATTSLGYGGGFYQSGRRSVGGVSRGPSATGRGYIGGMGLVHWSIQ